MSDDVELNRVLQKAILNLHDVKPKDPIRFLADNFACESEDDPLSTAINLFDSLTIFHPITEERITKCYDMLTSSDEFEGPLIGACYSKFMRQFVKRLCMPLDLRKPILDYSDRHFSSVLSCLTLRRAILTVLLYKQYFEEMYCAFDKLISSPDIAPTYKCEHLLIHASICLKNIHDIPREYPYTLGIHMFCDPYKLFRSSSKDSVCDEFWNIKYFMVAAKELFFHEIDDLNLSRFRLYDFKYEEDQYNLYKSDRSKHGEDALEEKSDGDEYEEDTFESKNNEDKLKENEQ